MAFQFTDPDTDRVPDFVHQPSDVLFEWDREEGVVAHDWTRGDADIEQEASILDDQIEGHLCKDTLPSGWYVMEGFSVDYSRDYWGEVSGGSDYSWLRPAGFWDFYRARIIPWTDGSFWADDTKTRTTPSQSLNFLQRVALWGLLRTTNVVWRMWDRAAVLLKRRD